MLELPRLYSENNLKNKQHNIIVMLLILFNTHVSRVGCEESPFYSLPVASIIYIQAKSNFNDPNLGGGGG